MKQMNILDSVVLGVVFVMMLAMAAEPVAAQRSEAGEVIGAVVTRVIVIAGAMVLVNVWQKWRERRGKK